jgi:hypothetical protein
MCNYYYEISYLQAHVWEHAVAQFIETLCYMPEGRGFDTVCSHWTFNLPNPSSHIIDWD